MKRVFVFPGQGAHVNKIITLKNYDSDLYNDELQIISNAYGFDVLDFACSADSNTLNQVKYTQLIMFASSVALLSIARKKGVIPDVVAGHSIGQFTAMYAAECFDLYELACLVDKRAKLMSEVSTVGKLCVIKAPFPINIEKIAQMCCDISCDCGRILSIALINSDKQVVVGGDVDAISCLISCIENEQLNYSSVILPVGQAFHTNLMLEMLQSFSKCIDEITINKPKIPIILNTTGQLYTNEDLKQELLDHCIKPVLWLQTMNELLKYENIQQFEVGLGHTLSGFFRNVSKTKVITMENKKMFFNSLK